MNKSKKSKIPSPAYAGISKQAGEEKGSGFDLAITGGRVIDPETKMDRIADVFVRNGVIKKIEKSRGKPKAKEIIDAVGKIVVPGLIDMHTHLREPGREDEETIFTGSCAAVAGGFTSICCMPNTQPPIDNQETVEFVYQKAKEAKCKI